MDSTGLIKVSEVKYLNSYLLELTFSDGLKGQIDFKEIIDGEVFRPLKNVEYFKTFIKDRWTISWDCGADFAPEYLYELVKKAHNKSYK